MIEFVRTGKIVAVHADSGTGVERPVLFFPREFSNEAVAVAMVNQYEQHMRKMMKTIRKNCYDQGWKDAKAKKKGKSTDFWGDFDTSPTSGVACD